MGWLQRFEALASWVAPTWTLRQAKAQLALQARRAYEAAGHGRRTAGWRSSGSSANAVILSGGRSLRERARQAERDNPYATKAISLIEANVVGSGIRAQPKGPSAKRVKTAAKAWTEWAESTACDFDGRCDLYGLEGLAVQAMVRDGEALIRLRRTADPKLGIPLQLQVLEVDLLDETRSVGQDGREVEGGLELDAEGRVVALWLHRRHPGERGTARSVGEGSVRVPASEVIRLYRMDRPGQRHGASWLAPVLLKLKDLDDFEDAQLVRQKIAACFAVFVKDLNEATPSLEPGEPLERIEPGIIEHLAPGQEVEFASPPAVEGYEAFVRQVLRQLAAGLGVTYEGLSSDLSQSNYSAGRMAHIEFSRNVDKWRWRTVVPVLLEPIWVAWVQACEIKGLDVAGVTAEWTPPRREMVDPEKEAKADSLAVRNGLKSWGEALRERGYDPEAVAEELARDRELWAKHGLVLDVDSAQRTQQGQAQKAAL